MSNQSLPEGKREWRVCEYASLYGGLTGATLIGWQVKLAGPQPANHERLIALSDLPKIIDQAKREERERLRRLMATEGAEAVEVALDQEANDAE